jgi:hypothetical protein
VKNAPPGKCYQDDKVPINMATDFTQLRSAIRGIVEQMGAPPIQDVEAAVRKELEELCNIGKLTLGPDHTLGGLYLQYRVARVFAAMGLQARPGRDGQEDLVIEPPNGLLPARPLVVEVKSSQKPYVSRDDLRQLDDWVFELSGEEGARKHGIAVPSAIVTFGFGARGRHPTPHKGVMVFNGPLSTPFGQRLRCLGANEEEFARKRSFVIMPFDKLLDCAAAITARGDLLSTIWSAIHAGEGLFALSTSDG